MEKARILFALCILTALSARTLRCEICTQSPCVYDFVVRTTMSMTYDTGESLYNVKTNGRKLEIAENSLRRVDEFPKNLYVGKEVNPYDVITLDGNPRTIIVINDQFPGPTIEVMEGTEVVVKVTNKLLTEGLTIHWHGMHQRGTPWMDGVPYVTQCPILPLQSFTYRFRASPAGTHWYHSHFGSQRTEGLMGMLVVHKVMPSTPYFIVSVMDWYSIGAREFDISNPFSIEFPGTGQYQNSDITRRFGHDDVEAGSRDFVSVLVNGRGRLAQTDTLPLQRFHVVKAQQYRFRMAHTGSEYGLEISIDSHHLQVVAVDGNEVEPMQVDAIMLTIGERVDFIMDAIQPRGCYWMRLRSWGVKNGIFTQPDDRIDEGWAIIDYDSSTLEPSSTYLTCSDSKPCFVFNCPFPAFPEIENKICISMAEARSSMDSHILKETYGLEDTANNVVEKFYNFNFALYSGINAHRFISPTAPLWQGMEGNTTPCPADCGQNGDCKCTHIDNILMNSVIQFTFVNTDAKIGTGHHPVHLHGNNFAVLKMGYPNYNETTGVWVKRNNEIECDTNLCASAKWREGHATNLNLNNPPIKDTVVVPSRGYVVVRFKSDNPGFWLMHCHIDIHAVEGMAMILHMGYNVQPNLPDEFPTCANFD